MVEDPAGQVPSPPRPRPRYRPRPVEPGRVEQAHGRQPRRRAARTAASSRVPQGRRSPRPASARRSLRFDSVITSARHTGPSPLGGVAKLVTARPVTPEVRVQLVAPASRCRRCWSDPLIRIGTPFIAEPERPGTFPPTTGIQTLIGSSGLLVLVHHRWGDGLGCRSSHRKNRDTDQRIDHTVPPAQTPQGAGPDRL